jgi:phosphoglycerate dehydrogenase-like enzyme
MRKKVFLSGAVRLPADAEEELQKGADIISIPAVADRGILPLVQDVHGIIAHGIAITENIIQAAPKLQIISTPWSVLTT